jgi:hypothetical protein
MESVRRSPRISSRGKTIPTSGKKIPKSKKSGKKSSSYRRTVTFRKPGNPKRKSKYRLKYEWMRFKNDACKDEVKELKTKLKRKRSKNKRSKNKLKISTKFLGSPKR